MTRKKEPERATNLLTHVHRAFAVVLALLLTVLAFPACADEKSKAGLPPEILTFIKTK